MNSASGLTSMVEMPEEWEPILNALIASPDACQSPAELAEALGSSVEETTDLLSAMDVSGWISVWDCDAGPIVTLSALAAERLQVVLIEQGPDETPRWARAGDPIPSPPRAKNVCRSERYAGLAGVPDPALTPDLAAERAERAERLAARAASSRTDHPPQFRVEDLPFPSLVLGQGLTPWPGPGQFSHADCPACGDRALLPHVYCLCCDRWGLDASLATIVKQSHAARPQPPASSTSAPAPAAIAPDRLADRKQREEYELARSRRKAKRQARRAAQEKQGRQRARDAG
jgi:hypothetical protein